MKKIAIVLLMLILHRSGISQSPALTNLQFNRLSIKDGMPSDIINCALQDKENYMWIGTQRGLVRYDGYKTKIYEFGLQELSRLNITALFEDRSGQLWVGTAGNLYSYDRALDSFTHYENDPGDSNSLSAGMVGAMRGDREGNLWLLISDGLDGKCTRLNVFNHSTHRFKRYDVLEKSGRYTYRTGTLNILEDSRGHIWFGTNDGAYEYLPDTEKFILHFASTGSERQKTFGWPSEDAFHPGTIWMNVRDTKSGKQEGLVKYTAGNNSAMFVHCGQRPGSLDTDSVYTIHTSSNGRLFFGTENGLSVLDSISDGFTNYPIRHKKKKSSDNQVWMFSEDSSHYIWCGNSVNLFLFDEKENVFSRYVPDQKDLQSLTGGTYNNLLTDRSGTVWMTTTFKGISWVKEKSSKFVVYQGNPGRAHHFPGGGGTSFTQGNDGTIWIWSSSGLYHWYPRQDSFELIKTMSRRPEEVAFPFSSSSRGKDGIIWCSTFGNGLYSYNSETKETRIFKTNEKDSSSLCSNQISALFVDKSGIIWIGTFGSGLCSLNPQTGIFRRYPYIHNKFKTPNYNALDDANVFSIYEDSENTIWVGTLIGGLNKLDRQSGIFTSYQNELPGFTTVTSIFEDKHGQLWAGTGNGGLFLFDRKHNTAKKFGETDGLIFSGALGMKEDNKNNLWATSPKGLSIINQNTKRISRLGIPNGLPILPEYNFNFFKTVAGTFLMPCEDGFVVFDPEKLGADPMVPAAHIESISFRKTNSNDNRETESTILTYGKKEIDLHYDENRISLEFVGLSFQNSLLIEYKYNLEGYDKNWTEAGTQRTASFGNLSPGSYIFHLKVANADGVWNPQEASLTIVIRPPWWRTWWAYTLYVVVFAAALRGYITYRSRHLTKRNNELEENVKTRTIELNKSLDELRSAQQQLIQSEKMASLGELTAGIAHEIQNPLNFVNNFSELNKEMIEEATEEAANGNFELMKSILIDIRENSEKIMYHGNRADAIVKGMLQHSRQTKGTRQPTDLNALCDEYLRLSYHGLRAKDKTFNSGFSTDLDPSVVTVDIVPQDIARVLLNLLNNAFYAVNEKRKAYELSPEKKYVPMVTLRTKKRESKVEIEIEDNGDGIPKSIIDKIFQPFFTSKPAGQGTGLGLSLAYDIITKGHNGSIIVDSKEGEGTTFKIYLGG